MLTADRLLLLLSLLMILSFGLTGCETLGFTPGCVDFEDQVPSQSFSVGQTISSSAVDFSVEQFVYGDGSTASDGSARIDDRQLSRGIGKDVNTRNVNLQPDLPHTINTVSANFGELGGNVNLRINGNFINVSDLKELNGTSLGGVTIVVGGVQEGSNYYGALLAIGPISDFSIGGQELWLDNICFNPAIRSCGTPDTDDLPVFAYNEGLATVLRGIEINTVAASELGVPAGYYRIREFRVWGAPEEKAKTFNILKPYAEMAIGASTLPVRDEEWVFSVIAVDDWEAHHRKYKGYDFHDHTFEYELTFDDANSCWETAARIDCVEVRLSTHTYLGETLNTCGWTSEPPWTTTP